MTALVSNSLTQVIKAIVLQLGGAALTNTRWTIIYKLVGQAHGSVWSWAVAANE